MNNITKFIAGYTAIAVFFIMAIIGIVMGHQPFTCGQRAILGAVITYIIVKIAGKLIYQVIFSAIVDIEVRKQMEEQEKRSR